MLVDVNDDNTEYNTWLGPNTLIGLASCIPQLISVVIGLNPTLSDKMVVTCSLTTHIVPKTTY
jgi:hypothetical protein